MKKINILIAIILLSTSAIFAQVPNAINFQAIARDANGDVMANTPIQIRLTIIEGSAMGTEIYQELRALTTNSYGSFSFQIGRNADYVTIGTFTDINWNTGNKFLKIDYDPTNQFNWDLTLGTIEFVSVPFAFSAGSVAYINIEGVQDGDALLYNAATGKFEPGQVSGGTVTWSNITGTPPNVSTFPNDANYLTSYTETDPIFTVNFDLSNVANGDLLQFNGTKFVKFTPNYLTSYTETDPTFAAWDKHTGISITKSQISDFGNYLTTETDGDTTNELQTFSEVLAKSADANNIAVNNLKIGGSSTCNATTEGTQRYNPVTKNMEFCNGTEWIPFNVGSPCSPQPTTANAGPDQIDISGTRTTLAANVPTEGTGKWTITSGTGGNFSDNTLATTNFTGIAGETYKLTWTISNACYASSDEVLVSFESPLPIQTLQLVKTIEHDNFGINDLDVYFENAYQLVAYSNISGNNSGDTLVIYDFKNDVILHEIIGVDWDFDVQFVDENQLLYKNNRKLYQVTDFTNPTTVELLSSGVKEFILSTDKSKVVIEDLSDHILLYDYDKNTGSLTLTNTYNIDANVNGSGGMAITEDNSYIAVAGGSEADYHEADFVTIINIANSQVTKVITPDNKGNYSPVFFYQNNELKVAVGGGYGNGSIEIIDVSSLSLVHSENVFSSYNYAVDVDETNKYLVCGGYNSELRLYNVDNFSFTNIFNSIVGHINKIKFSNDNQYIILGSGAGYGGKLLIYRIIK